MNKKELVRDFIDYMLIKTQKMFKWENLPDTVPDYIIENYLQTMGKVIFYKYGDNFYTLPFSYVNNLSVYQTPDKILINNIALNLTMEKNIDINGECDSGYVIKNDSKEKSLVPIFNKYGELLSECDITIKNISQLERMKMFIVSTDEKTKAESRKFLDDIINGKLSAIGGSPIFDSVKLFSGGSYSNNINSFIELIQYLKASCLNEIGINSNYNMKRERINESEIQLNDFGLMPLCENMLDERKKAVERINKKFNLDIKVSFNSVWKKEQSIIENTEELSEEKIEEQTEIEENEQQAL